MKPQKKSIRDFFAPISRSSQQTQKSTPVHRGTASLTMSHASLRLIHVTKSDASNAQAPQSSNSSTSRGLHDQTSVAAGSHSPPIASTPSTATTAPTTTRAASDEAGPPQPSQNSANSGASKRIVSNGEQVVLNSDSDTDSLPDLDWGEPKISSKMSTTTTRSKRPLEQNDNDLRRPVKKEKSNKRSFSLLVETAHRSMETERRIIEHKAELNKSFEEPTKANITINEDVLGQVVQDDDDDPEKAHRLFLAMQRTNATQLESVFYFFEDTTGAMPAQSKFPSSSLPKHRWASNFEGVFAVSCRACRADVC